jgi:beta-glucosidase
VKASHHLLLGHGLAARVVAEATGPKSKVGIALNLSPVSSVTKSAEDVAAARRLDAHLNRWFLDPVLKGHYPAELLDECLRLAGGDFLRDGDLETIRAQVDFLGANYYESRRVAAAPAREERGAVPGAPGGPTYVDWLGVVDRRREDLARTSKGWAIDPAGLTELLLGLRADYGDIPLFVTENGAAFADYVDPEGHVKDPERVEFLRQHFAAAHAAIVQGVDLRGYSVWSLLDNYEWADGYSQRFGIVFVDYGTQQRIPKSSAYWMRDVIAANAVDTD